MNKKFWNAYMAETKRLNEQSKRPVTAEEAIAQQKRLNESRGIVDPYLGLSAEELKKMKYLNQFHKESTERKLRKMEEWKKQPIDCANESARMKRLVAEAEKLYPPKKD